MIDWNSVFDEVQRGQPATEQVIAQLRSLLSSPVSGSEQAQIRGAQVNPFPPQTSEHATWVPIDPTEWQLPDIELPIAFKDYLRWSNGGWARTGEREFGFFGVAGMRDYMLRYMFPEYMRGVVPFAFNGGGIFYAFDVRSRPSEDEYPIIAVASGVLDFDSSPVVGLTFIDVCKGRVNVDDILYPPPPEPALPDRGDLWIIKPPNSLKAMANIKRLLGLDTPLGELRAAMTAAPCRLARNISCNHIASLLASSPDLQELLAVTDTNSKTFLDWP